MIFKRPNRRKRRSRSSDVESLEARALLTTFTVTSLEDTIADDGQVTLREAILQAQLDTDHDDIVFADGLSGVVNLALGEIALTPGQITITGNGRDQTVIDAGHSSDIFVTQLDSQSGTSLTLSSLTLKDAESNAIHHYGFGDNGAAFVLEDSRITGSERAAIFLNVYESNNNYYAGSYLRVSNSVLDKNNVGLGFRSGVYAVIEDSVITDNDSGGIISGEYAEGSGSPSVTITRSIISNNRSAGRGGGIYHYDGTLTISDSLISGNEALDGRGGGVHGAGGNVNISGTTFSNNTSGQAGGGLYGANSVRNSTFTGNTAENGGGLAGSVRSVQNNTFTLNHATEDGGGAFAFDGNNWNSNIFSANTASASGADLMLTNPVSNNFTHNFVGTNSGTNLAATGTSAPDANGNLVGSDASPIDPLLSELTDVGILSVHLLSPGSPALDRGSNPADLTTDQLGNAREQGLGVDMGAVESAGVLTVQDVTVTEGDAGTTSLVFTIELPATVDGPFTIDVATVDGTATAADGDYVAVSETLSFAGTAGESKQVTVQVNGDLEVEADEAFTLVLSNVSDPNVPVPPDAVGTVINDDFSGNITLANGVLTVQGSELADDIDFNIEGTSIKARLGVETIAFAEADVESIVVHAEGGDDLVIARFVNAPMLVEGGEGNDTVKGGLGNDTLLGGIGDDKLRGTRGDDTISGGDGNDSLLGHFGDDTLDGGLGNDTLRGNEGNDTLLGRDGRDLAFGGDGNDSLIGAGGNDYLDGEIGDDYVYGGDGDDRIIGAGGNDTLNGGQGIDRVRGGGGHDFLSGAGGDDTLGGNNGRDTLFGWGGNDYLNSGEGADLLSGGDGDDTLRGRGGDDVLAGGRGDDFLKGLFGRDIIYGGEGVDSVYGNAGEDVLIAGALSEVVGDTAVMQHLGELISEWRSDRSYAQRVANITNSPQKSSDRLNGNNYLIGSGRDFQNVFDDGVQDDIRSSGGIDLFFARVGSDLLDNKPNEILEAI